jgi:two-component system, cell cycle sensor histidine kinase PleC
LSNAIKFTEPRGSVAITARHTEDGRMAFEVRDTGLGMTASEIEIALEPFGQIDPGYTTTHQGTGLGLPLARRLAELHGGSLRIESEKGRGTTVTVTLPGPTASGESSAAANNAVAMLDEVAG